MVSGVTFDLTGASLMLTFSVPALMGPPNQCADGTECESLRTLDYLLWTACTFFLLYSVGAAWLTHYAVSMQRNEDIARWIRDNCADAHSSASAFIFGHVTLCAAIGTRSRIMLASQPLGMLVMLVMFALLLLTWRIWFSICMTVGGLHWSQLVWNQLGAFGIYLPRRLLHGGAHGDSRLAAAGPPGVGKGGCGGGGAAAAAVGSATGSTGRSSGGKTTGRRVV